jgi:glycerophosphoryl diester phosphodiesterase
MATLKTLDIGHGYTADGGKPFPFRGKGVGLMPTLTEVLQRFPDRRFQRQEQRCEALAAFLAALDAGRRSRPTVYGGDEPVDVVKRLLPGMRVFSRRTVKACAKAYAGLGWSGYVAEACRGSTTLMIPTNVAPWLWG